jgi:uncharacterized membrane protein SpoIIM required for sporulation
MKAMGRSLQEGFINSHHRKVLVVLENLTNAWKAEHRPHMLILWGMVYAILGGLLAMLLFPKSLQSMVMVALSTIACIPLLYNTIKYEEEKDMHIIGEQKLLKEHSKAIMVFLMLFVGLTFGMTLLYTALPVNSAASLFSGQIDTYKAINPAQQVTGHVTQGGMFQRIFFNNLKVLFFCLIFSLLYGAGAMFVLSWNASVIALAMGNVIRTQIAAIAAQTGAATIVDYMRVIAIDSFSRYFIHGIFEIGSYIIAALAGGIISVAVIKKHFLTDKTDHIILDVSDLLLASFVILLFAAAIETYVTPAIFGL